MCFGDKSVKNNVYSKHKKKQLSNWFALVVNYSVASDKRGLPRKPI